MICSRFSRVQPPQNPSAQSASPSSCIAPVIAASQARWAECEIEERAFGPQPEAPEVSVIVPLYGRHDFVEHQLMEFCRDPYMRERAEIVYVVDDPAIVISSGWGTVCSCLRLPGSATRIGYEPVISAARETPQTGCA